MHDLSVGYGSGVQSPATTPASRADERLRFAPSPTGALHMGSAMVAVANAAIAREGGTLVLRIDDTDDARADAAHVGSLLRLLGWLGVAWDEGPVRQSERVAQHSAALATLAAAGETYPCFCSQERLAELRARQLAQAEPPRYDGRCRGLSDSARRQMQADGDPATVRLATDPGRDVSFVDEVRGSVTVPAGSHGDPVLARADGSAGYLLASVVDDINLGITLVVRGEDHLVNTARQQALFVALGAEPPRTAHLPLLRSADGRKLSKRDADAAGGALAALAANGTPPAAVRRYLGELLGQGAIDPVAAAAPAFRFDRVPHGAPRLDLDRLRDLAVSEFAATDDDALRQFATAVVDVPLAAPHRLLRELAGAAPDSAAFAAQARTTLGAPDAASVHAQLGAHPVAAAALNFAAEALAQREAASDDDSETAAEAWLVSVRAHARSGAGMRATLQPIRIALTGATGGPGLDLIVAALGLAESRRRLLAALRGDSGASG